MTSYSKFLITGSEYYPENINVTRSVGETNAASKFTANFNNYIGKYTGSFNIGEQVDIYAARDINNNFMDSISGVFITQWKLNGDATDFFNNDNGTIVDRGITPYYEDGKIGSAINFPNQNSAIYFSAIGSYDFTNNNSVSFFSWIYPSGTPFVSKQVIFAKSRPHQYHYDFSHTSGTTNLDLTLTKYTSKSYLGAFESLTINNAITKDTWNHVGFTKNGSLYKIFVNGSNVGSSFMTSGPTITTTSYAALGAVYRGAGTTSYDFIGKIDDARFYGYEISDAIIGSIYNAGSGTENAYGIIYQNNPDYKIFSGIIEDIDLKGKESKETLALTGKDYTVRLLERTVEPESYNNLYAGSIVKDIINKYTDDIVAYDIENGKTVDRIVFNHMPVFDAIKKLAELSNYVFYVDNNKNLHFKNKSQTSSGFIFGSGGTPILEASFKEKRDELYNDIWVYGDRYLDGFREQFDGDGTGSIFTLLYKPHNTNITLGSGATDLTTIQPGGIYQEALGVGSNVKFLVSYQDKQIIFTSGTQQGYNIPPAGSQITINYYRKLPIVKYGDNDESIKNYGRRTKVIQDKTITDPVSAEAILLSELEEYSEPLKQGTLHLKDVARINPGDTCIVNIPSYNISSTNYDILEAKYNITKQNLLNDNILSIKVNKNIPDITDTLKKLILKQKGMESEDIASTDLLTRYKFTIGSMGIRQSGLTVWLIGIGSSFILGNSVNGMLGSYPTHYLGNYKTGSTISWSGGYF